MGFDVDNLGAALRAGAGSLRILRMTVGAMDHCGALLYAGLRINKSPGSSQQALKLE
jgi:hypothetical protein